VASCRASVPDTDKAGVPEACLPGLGPAIFRVFGVFRGSNLRFNAFETTNPRYRFPHTLPEVSG
jgi:hypothetical protein